MPSTTTPSLRSGLQPVVILGAPRSGTKLLRDLLSQSSACTTIPYGVNHVWRRGLPATAPDRRAATDATTQYRREIRSALVDLAGARRRPHSGYLVEKTCANTLRVPFVNQVLPDAHLIHIVRDGRDAAVSAQEQWKRPPSPGYLLGKLRYVPLQHASFLLEYLRNLWTGLWTDGHVQYWGPRYEGIEEDVRERPLLAVCARQWRACVTTCLDDLAQRPDDRVTSIRYEALVRNRATIERVIAALDLPDPDAIRSRYETVVHDRSVGRWRRDLSSSEREMVHDLLAPTLHRIADTSSLSPA